MKILFGIVQPDSGLIEIEGQEVRLDSPLDAQALGISMVHQELNLIPALDVARNIYLGREPMHAGLIDWSRLYAGADAQIARLNLPLRAKDPVRRLSTAQKQLVEIARALSWQPKLLILDEPTSSLTQSEIAELFRILRQLREQGVSVLYISHRLEELAQIADRVTVFRDGKLVGTLPAQVTPIPDLIRMMVGRSVDQLFPKVSTSPGEEILRVDHLDRGAQVRDVSFSVRAGEIVGMAGLVGAGRTETARLIFGADRAVSGAVSMRGTPIVLHGPRDAIAAGIALLPEDRKLQGLVLPLSVERNVSLATLDSVSAAGVVNQKKRRSLAERFIRDLRIRTPGPGFRVRNLSGGNQQKVVLGKWLAAEPTLFIFDEPTRGIDVGAKVEVYGFMNSLVQRGAAVLLISSELPEVLGMSDRVLVMHEGRLVANLPRDHATPERVIAYASGERPDQESINA
jgi:ribose transport system ATP-binding protein